VTKQCIESIRQNCNPETYELIVIDNASHDGSVKWLREQTDIVLIENQENVGFPAGCNQGIAASIPENDIMLLNSDTIVMPNAMFTLRMGLYDSQRNGAAGSVTNKAGNSQKIDKVFDNIAQYHTFAATNNVPCENAYEYKVWLVGFALLLKRTALDQVGLLDERFTPGNFEDNDLGIRFSKKGFRNVLCWNSFIYHWESKSFKQNKSINYDQLYYTNLEKYKEKWGIGPSYYTNAREDIMGMITQDSQSFIRVLEIGCGAGVTLGRILHCYPNAEAYGIELVKEIADLGALNYNVICGNIEQMELPYEKGYFDYIIFGDVLEHLVHPDRVLMRVCDYLKQDGCVLASIPNLMNAEVIYDLLHGRFPYEDSGVRDATHLRFFTYQEILRLFETAGYQVEGVWRTMMEECTTNAYGDFFNQLLAIEGVAGREEFDAYQYLVRARVAL
jgi:GT2 family glycosyltransferase/trans-aconitate methyltransferase